MNKNSAWSLDIVICSFLGNLSGSLTSVLGVSFTSDSLISGFLVTVIGSLHFSCACLNTFSTSGMTNFSLI